MTDLRSKKPNARDWRSHLTPEERKQVTALEREVAKLTERISVLRVQRLRIQNRATVRAKR